MLEALRAYDADTCSLDETLNAVLEYEAVVGVKKSYELEYRRTLAARPWRACQCGLCEKHGIDVAIFRGTERNKRRGFHNLSILSRKISDLPFKRLATERRHEQAL